jgi:hypothetical protein
MPPHLSGITRATLRWLEGGGTKALIEYLETVGSSQAQIDLWLSYAAEMGAVEGETLAEVIETEVALAVRQVAGKNPIRVTPPWGVRALPYPGSG